MAPGDDDDLRARPSVVSPVASLLRYFRDEIDNHVRAANLIPVVIGRVR